MGRPVARIGRRRRMWVLPVALVGSVAVAGLPQGIATPVEFSGLTRSTTINASRDAVWYGQMTANGVCGLFPSCVSATKTANGYRLVVAGNVPGLGSVTQDVEATVVKKVRPRLVRMKLAAASGLGSVNGTISLTLLPKSAHRTTVRVHVNKATGTGALGTVMLPFLAQGLPNGLKTAAATLNGQRRSSGIDVLATRTKGRVQVSVLLKNPGVQPAPTASGRLRVLTTKSKVACRARVKKSKATCRVRGKHKNLQAVVTGSFSSGFQVWHSAKVRVAK